MPPKKTTTIKKGTQAEGQTFPHIIELPPSDPQSPGSSNLGEGSYYEAPTSDLATALTLLAQSLSTPKKNPKRTKVWELDVFDGLDTHKLQPFLVQCTLNFRNCPDAFSTNSAKVTFALSYLKGTALNWFKLSLTSSLNLTWLNDYSNFILELRKNFRPHDPEGKGKGKLENLCMHENQRIVKYLIDFNQLATHVQWGEAALCWQLYHGLLSQIKDEITHISKPNTLSELCTLAQSINSCYWERCSEVARETLTAPKPECSNDRGKGTNAKANNTTTLNSDKNKNNNNNNKNNSGNSSTSNTTGNTNSGNANQKKPNSDLSSKLRKDSKLTQQECQCHFDQNLCLFCRKGGHVMKHCSKATSSTAKGSSATIMDKTSKAKPGLESKNPWAVLLSLHQLRTVLNSPVHLWSHDSMHLLFTTQTPLQSLLPLTLFQILRSVPS